MSARLADPASCGFRRKLSCMSFACQRVQHFMVPVLLCGAVASCQRDGVWKLPL